MTDWLTANLDLRRRRDAIDAAAKREAQAAEARRQFEADKRAGLPEVRPGGH